MSNPNPMKPTTVTDLEAAYGPPSQEGFGSAVFHEELAIAGGLERQAVATYRHFVGERWDRFGESVWMGPWRTVYRRASDAKQDIVAELRGISDPAAVSVPLILEVIENAESARAALAAVYNDPAVTDLRVFNVGDGEAMSGLLVAGHRGAENTAIYLVVLMD